MSKKQTVPLLLYLNWVPVILLGTPAEIKCTDIVLRYGVPPCVSPVNSCTVHWHWSAQYDQGQEFSLWTEKTVWMSETWSCNILSISYPMALPADGIHWADGDESTHPHPPFSPSRWNRMGKNPMLTNSTPTDTSTAAGVLLNNDCELTICHNTRGI